MSLKNNITKIAKKAFTLLNEDETLNLYLVGEQTKFIRINNSKIRQTTDVEQFQFNCSLIKNNRRLEFECMIESWELDVMTTVIQNQLDKARQMIDDLPEDHFILIAKNQVSENDYQKNEINIDETVTSILRKTKSYDFCGIFTAGNMYRAFFNNHDCHHWFATTLNTIDYSIYAEKQRAVKGSYSSQTWNQNEFESELNRSLEFLGLMNRPWHQLERGKYRCYLAPDAVADLVGMLSWCGVSFKDYKIGNSSLKKLHDGKHWNKKFNLSEDLSSGAVPTFNNNGEVATPKISIIKEGRLENFLTTPRSAKEYDVDNSTCAAFEYLQCPSLEAGTLSEDDVLKELGTGLYFSNLHYLSWSDLNNGRLTGMTRFACFWVEDGKIVAPIKEMRFDDELYHIFGGGLIELTQKAKSIAVNDTYFQRNMGLLKVPGALINDFTLTL